MILLSRLFFSIMLVFSLTLCSLCMINAMEQQSHVTPSLTEIELEQLLAQKEANLVIEREDIRKQLRQLQKMVDSLQRRPQSSLPDFQTHQKTD